jgi:hypothetical protein
MPNFSILSGWTIRKTSPESTKSRPDRLFITSFTTPALALTILFLLNFAGCGEDSITNEEDSITAEVEPLSLGNLSLGTFRAEITGAAETTLEGIATFNSSDDEPGFVLSLAVLGPDGITLWRNEGRPPAGEYEVIGFTTVVIFGQPGFGGSLLLAQHGGFYATQSGAITITNSSVTNLAGEFEFTAVDDEDEYASNVQEITVTGAFRARCDGTCL